MTGETVMTLAAFPVNTKLWTQAGQLDKLAAILNTSLYGCMTGYPS